MMRILILILFVFPVSFCHLVKYKSAYHFFWRLADYPRRPCRAEEGWIRCDSLQLCMKRDFWNYCPGLTLHQCNDDELKYTFSDEKTRCVRRDQMHEHFNREKYFPCHHDEYECRSSKKCIPREWKQDGVVDCSLYANREEWPNYQEYVDDSDEENSLDNCNKQTEYKCQGNKTKCIPRHLVMNGIPDCQNNDDEYTSLECHSETEFECAENHRCIPRRYVNDGFSDCPNNTDQYNPSFTCNDRFEFSCNNTNEFEQCTPRAWVRNGVNDCSNGQDEHATISECYDTEFSCLDNKRCLPFKYLCDGIQNCADGSDEIELCSSPTMYRYSPSKPLVPWDFVIFRHTSTLVWNYPDFHLQYDLAFGMKCKTNLKKITTKVNNVSPLLRNVPQIYITNSISVCYNKEDICFGNEGTFQCARCLDGMIISKSQICDGMIDCKDLSDECSCEESEIKELCENMFSFQNSAEKNQSIFDTICNGNEDMINGIDESYCENQVLLDMDYSFYNNDTNNYTNFECTSQYPGSSSVLFKNMNPKFCDGHLDCPLMEDECSSECLMRNLHTKTVQSCFPFLQQYDHQTFKFNILYTGNGDMTLTNSSHTSSCKIFVVLRKKYIILRTFKTSINDRCKTHYDYSANMNLLCNIIGVNCPWMHNCGTNQSKQIEIFKRCDYQNDCDDNSDEMNCSNKTHFYCRNQMPLFIPRSKVADGRSDCSDRSDECRETAFSSASEMLKDTFFNVSVWICAILILINNFLVIVKHLRKMRAIRSKATVSYCNRFLLINLSCSDMIFGFNLLAIGIKSQQFSGNYCEHDLEWRSSLPCNMVGIFTVISSQTSMNLLVVMTGLRVYITYYPYITKSLNFTRLKFATFLCLGCSVFLATFPVWGNTNFINSFYIKPNLFLKDQIVKRSQMELYAEKTITIALLSNFSEEVSVSTRGSFITETLTSWVFNTDKGKAKFPNRHVDVIGSFGFYSSSSVCFPDLYSEHSSASHYSLFIVLYNLGCLIVIVMGYCFIFYKSRKSAVSVQTADEASASRKMNKMMKRIFFIVATDAICWIPIIAMSIHSYRGYKLPEIVHPLSALVFLPINSMINPIIYSRLYRALKRKFIKLWSRIFGECGSVNTDNSASTEHRVTAV